MESNKDRKKQDNIEEEFSQMNKEEMDKVIIGGIPLDDKIRLGPIPKYLKYSKS